ncbi:MAG: formylglycine-generating enzyme family protein [Candidatus Latescibacterota bacterium]|nr:MAG: formylglycine-generating enzyme family protein [Candidatus Latescibacterota bacterium]
MHRALRAGEHGSRSTLPLRLLLAAALCGVALSGCPLFKKTSSKAPSLQGMALVPAGEFTMGRESEDASPDEAPVRSVWLDEFYIDRLEVTNAQYKSFADSVGRLYPNNPIWDDGYFLGKPDHPVINLTYEQAQAYCAWLGKRLPTEAEWEKAARGTDARIYAWGNEWDETRANLWGDEHGPDVFRRTAPVGSFPEGASPYGVLDMVGNVWEWCADWFELDYYSRAPDRNPPGPEGPAKWRVVRGGGFSSPRRPVGDVTTSNRSKNVGTQTIHHLGCRCAWSPR